MSTIASIIAHKNLFPAGPVITMMVIITVIQIIITNAHVFIKCYSDSKNLYYLIIICLYYDQKDIIINDNST